MIFWRSGGQPTQLHVEDRVGLDLVDVESFDQPRRASSTSGDRRISAITSSRGRAP